MHPFLLTPLFKPKPWGGRRLAEFGKDLPLGDIGESWEVADLPEAVASPGRTMVATGTHAGRSLTDLIETHRQDLLGRASPWLDRTFPLLIKLLDAREHLSIQVHPGRAFTAKHPDTHTKSESWYVVAADPGSVIFSGLREGVSRGELEEAAGTGGMPSLLRRLPARAGELHDLPAGTIHALGAGVVVAEVQTPSDTTFRLYDWTEEFGRAPRQLNIDDALQVVDIHSRPEPIVSAPSGSRHLITTPYYAINEHRSVGTDVRGIAILMVVDGTVSVSGAQHTIGATVVVPASAGPIEVDSTRGTVVEVTPV